MTTAFERLVHRNEGWQARHDTTGQAVEPSLRAVLLCCADHRADPAHVLGLGPNEVVVLRNPGGRVTTAFLHELAVLATVAQIEGLSAGFELILMHHTDCGLSRLAGDEHRNLLADYLGIDADDVPNRRVDDPEAAIASDLAVLRDNPFVPATLVVSASVYDIDTGHVRVVSNPAPLRNDRRPPVRRRTH